MRSSTDKMFMFSCPCLYDECVISYYLKENFEEIESRIINVVKSNYDKKIDLQFQTLI